MALPSLLPCHFRGRHPRPAFLDQRAQALPTPRSHQNVRGRRETSASTRLQTFEESARDLVQIYSSDRQAPGHPRFGLFTAGGKHAASLHHEFDV